MKNFNKCIGCGKADHIKKNSPKAEEKNVGATVLAKLNKVNGGEAATNNLVQVMIVVFDISTLICFDSGCTLSFMAYNLARKLGVTARTLDPLLIISTPNRDQTLVHKQGVQILIHVQGM